ncbi:MULTISPECIES: molybdenum ABC transporter ATP-binding protein [Methylobacterium]|jgi:molybdate transport system ATP-binding protein|uniref:molybdenum ABC transporter ATP-binding protein n=1 Tax=Methylobacterium TaxID=407 RepID=UPI0008F402CF|nr:MULTISPECIES: molybdenum ABC transporter ATP-binding protein [Methylobacterium]MBZ6411889.1 molybdenum ABC transporter ATP-binding protein [Methylobacterium sp.]MBK3398196.1 molybdenum ABC transporter ATP-binding protein [Methylobacterium ajmalii]MBK3407468.1 molybdenum ABC transporter ATP-binding protein [Methylobacterium ajmalii]MBK3424456.1 molybdenum ABC transporter ATP-binding protein [Methylobacterium ajmalii]SFF17970.1 molybdate transport system ATP-binding protein [Methylobacterium 
MIEVSVRHRRGAFALEAEFAAAGRVTALFGRSGSGKSTLVDVIAGLVRPDRGRIVVDGVVLLDTAARIRVPVHRRRIGYVFQEARLMPHLSVRQNLLFGRFFARHRSGGPSLDAVADLLGIAPLLERRPAGLSGGERQRVAIGRALLARPRLLLMDEPLSALDAARKAEILPYVAQLRDEARVPIVYVSHAVAEVARLADTVVVLDEGRVAACGPAAEVLRRAALFPGRETAETGALLSLRVAAHDDAFGLTHLDGAPGRLTVPRVPLPTGSSLRVRVRARDVLVAREAPRGLSARNVLPGTVVAVTPGEGAHARVEIACGGAVLVAEVTRLAAHELGLAPGLPVLAIVKSVAFDEETIGVLEI